LILLYWHIGRKILAKQPQEGWGRKVGKRLAKDLRREFTGMKGFSRSNLMYMSAFAEAWPDEQIVQRTVGQLPWRHNIALIEKPSRKGDRESAIAHRQQTI
jgi:predicted nuclease of restriction endonuclease-like (RecB) superfamily